MGSMVYSLLWVMQDFDHQPYDSVCANLAVWNVHRESVANSEQGLAYSCA